MHTRSIIYSADIRRTNKNVTPQALPRIDNWHDIFDMNIKPGWVLSAYEVPGLPLHVFAKSCLLRSKIDHVPCTVLHCQEPRNLPERRARRSAAASSSARAMVAGIALQTVCTGAFQRVCRSMVLNGTSRQTGQA